MDKYFVEQEEDEEEFKDTHDGVPHTEQTLISLHALWGKVNPKIIRMRGWIDCTPISVLVNSGLMHNFIQTLVAQCLHLPMEEVVGLTVSTGSDANLVCKSQKMEVHGTAVSVDLFLLPVAGSNVILGIQWLTTLGPVVTDYSQRLMTFELDGASVHWEGESWINDSLMTNKELGL